MYRYIINLYKCINIKKYYKYINICSPDVKRSSAAQQRNNTEEIPPPAEHSGSTRPAGRTLDQSAAFEKHKPHASYYFIQCMCSL